MFAIAKSLVEIHRRALLSAQTQSSCIDSLKAAKAINKSGFFIREKYWDMEKVNQAIKEIDILCQGKHIRNSWVDSVGSDHRFFRAETHNSIFNKFCNDPFIDEVRKIYKGRLKADKCVLAAKLLHKENNEGSGGGWHMDSPFSLQFMAFLFLTEVNECNGPLEIILQTRKNLLRLKLELNGLKKPGQYRFTANEGKNIQSFCGQSHVFLARPGDLIMADVSALHRGRPIRSGMRYALTLYCGDPDITEKLE